MGEQITVKSVEVIYSGLLQIDIWFEDQNKGGRIFIHPDKFFEMLGQSMQKNYQEYMSKNY